MSAESHSVSQETPNLGFFSKFQFEIGRTFASTVLHPVAETVSKRMRHSIDATYYDEARWQPFVYVSATGRRSVDAKMRQVSNLNLENKPKFNVFSGCRKTRHAFRISVKWADLVVFRDALAVF